MVPLLLEVVKGTSEQECPDCEELPECPEEPDAAFEGV
jgi:hypothetical protein